jgi:hypothetical protein
MRVVVAGGGIAALEVLTGLRALAGEGVDATLLAPDRSFSYRPLSMASPFTFLDEVNRPLAELAVGLGATFVRDGLAQVDEARGRVLTHDGDFLPYDALVIWRRWGANCPCDAPVPSVVRSRVRVRRGAPNVGRGSGVLPRRGWGAALAAPGVDRRG